MGNDTNYRVFVGPDHNGTVNELGDLTPPPGTASAIKCTTGVTGLIVRAGKVVGGHDALVDCNNKARGVEVTIDVGVPLGEFAAVIKGGCRSVAITIRNLLNHGKVADVILDDWADQSHDSTGDVRLNITRADGKAVRVMAFKAKPTFAPGSGPYTYCFPWSPLGSFSWLGYPLGFAFQYFNPRWLGYPLGFAFDTLRRWGFGPAKAGADLSASPGS